MNRKIPWMTRYGPSSVRFPRHGSIDEYSVANRCEYGRNSTAARPNTPAAFTTAHCHRGQSATITNAAASTKYVGRSHVFVGFNDPNTSASSTSAQLLRDNT